MSFTPEEMLRTPEEMLRDHCRMMIKFIMKGNLIPFFGAGVNLADRPLGETFVRGKYLPSGKELSLDLASSYAYPWTERDNLMRVSWHASYKGGADFLYDYLNELFSLDYPLTSVHKFFAGLPRRLADKGYPDRHQLIVTTNYDELLERAFKEAGEPYDLLTYVSDSRNVIEFGKFRYTPDGGTPEIIDEPNQRDLPFERTVILKVHGAVSTTGGERSGFVVTEDDYIDYIEMMTKGSNLIPAVLLGEMVRKPFLFLGYSLSDWNLRVLIKNINKQRRSKYRSWAIMNEPAQWDGTYWDNHDVNLMEWSLTDYVTALDEALNALPDREGVGSR
jgi:hypothetical protein